MNANSTEPMYAYNYNANATVLPVVYREPLSANIAIIDQPPENALVPEERQLRHIRIPERY